MSELLERYVPLVAFLGEILGSDTEVVLQDCGERQCIAAIANGAVTGRRVGSPLTDLSLKIITEGSWKTEPYITCYGGQSRTGHKLQCSTFFIKEDGQLHGLLCINRDVTVPEQLLASLEHYLCIGSHMAAGDRGGKYAESFAPSIRDMVEETMEECLGKDYAVLAPRLKQDEKVMIIRKLEERQVFLLKGAVSEVADVMGCSEASVYRYLAKKQKGGKDIGLK